MSLNFNGFVLRAPRVSPTNASTTAEPSSGVVRDVKPLPVAYDTTAPDLVDAAADQYRAAHLNTETTTEYLFWAQNDSQLALAEDDSWWVSDGEARIPNGTLSVTNTAPSPYDGRDIPSGFSTLHDGSARVVVVDNGGRSIAQITHLVVARGDLSYDDGGWVDEENPSAGRAGASPYTVLDILESDQDGASGLVRLSDSQLALLDGGLSNSRGDRVVEVRYVLATARFWWTRNDERETRFGWNSRTQKWEPYKGSAPIPLGILEYDTTYRLSPVMVGYPLGMYLPGDAEAPGQYAMLRVGSNPGEGSIPVEAFVVLDSEVESSYDFARNADLVAVVGRTSGILQFNPSFVAQYTGQTIWYSYQGFTEDATGAVGLLGEGVLYVSPIPPPRSRPFIAIGARRSLTPILVSSESDLADQDVAEGEVAVALSTGRLKFSLSDLEKCDPDSERFDASYYGAVVNYNGIALNASPQPAKEPVRLVGDSGFAEVLTATNSLYIPDAVSLPVPVSGVLDVPDGTGAVPGQPGVAASVRPGGDTVGDPTTGRVRSVSDGVGDTILFSRKGAVAEIIVEDFASDLPPLPFKVPKGTAHIAKERSTYGSKVVISGADRKRWLGEHVYFMQASFTPACYTTEAQVISKVRDSFTVSDSDTLLFAVDGTSYTWLGSSLTSAYPSQASFTAEQVAASLDAVMVGTGRCYALNGWVVIEAGNLSTGSVEIGFGGATKDLSGCAALGFLPGWRVVGGTGNWLADTGLSLGLYRSPVNLDRNSPTPDFRATERLEDQVLQERVSALPFAFLDHVPLEDIPGYDEGTFFRLTTAVGAEVYTRDLHNYVDVKHLFDERKIAWLEAGAVSQAVTQPTEALDLGNISIVPESLLGSFGGNLSVARDGGGFETLSQGDDYLLPGEGQQGIAHLVSRVGRLLSSGSTGTWAKNDHTFTASDADFTSVTEGCRLKVLAGDSAEGSYVVTGVVNSTTLTVEPAFPSASPRPSSWELYEGFTSSVYDPGLIADFVFKDFSHFQEEPFAVRLLTYLGDIPESEDSFISNRPVASVGSARASGRVLGLRFGLDHAPGADLTVLSKVPLGVLANDSLYVEVGTDRYEAGAFKIQVGRTTHTPVGVVALSPDPVGVEYRLSDGLLRFSSSLLSNYAASDVYYVEDFFAPSKLPAGVGEYDPFSGEVNMSALDIAQYQGMRLYLTERLIVGTDVAINPQAGAFTLRAPAQRGQIVEAGYYAAEASGARAGDPIAEFLPVYVRNEIATRLGANEYTFNSDGALTVDERSNPTVYVGSLLQNYSRTDYTLIYDDDGVGHLVFHRGIPETAKVKVTYAVFEAQGGETGYQASTTPFYRPPFFLEAGQSRFGLRGDRREDLKPGQLLRLGSECFYIRRVKYFEDSDSTAVTIFPTPHKEVGSRSPGNDVVMVITAQPVTSLVDPDGDAPVVVEDAPAGFMQPLSLSVFPFEPIASGQQQIVFRGNLTTTIAPGHILEIEGRPLTVAQVTLDVDGSRTTVRLTAPFWHNLKVEDAPSAKVSVRPIYPPGVRSFVGLGAVLASEGYEVVRWATTGKGTTLTVNSDYRLDEADGRVVLTNRQPPLLPGERLSISFTKRDRLSPVLTDGVIALPRYEARYRFNTSPSTTNGYLNGTLRGTYTFPNPDCFYVRVVPLSAFLNEAVKRNQAGIGSQQPSSGAVISSPSALENWEQGRIGIRSERRDLLDLDRVARAFLGFYNTAVETFEQIPETISGVFIGDRDGKFRFEVGRGREYPAPGYEDEITGTLTPRNLWSLVFHANSGQEIQVTEKDYIVNPSSASLTSGVLDGGFLDADVLSRLMGEQAALVRNDVDDRVLVGLSSTEVVKQPIAPYRKLRAYGQFKRMADTHQFSRLFPTRARVFFTTYPGVGGTAESPEGRYTWGVMQDGRRLSTYRKEIAQVSNPALGEIRNITDGVFAKRRARARIWGYYPDGLPAGAFVLEGGGGSPAINKPCLIATPAPLQEVVVDGSTGYPDRTIFLSQGGEAPDLQVGDPDLSIPGFDSGMQIGWGTSDGLTHDAFFMEPVDVFGTQGLTGVFVDEVLYGCVVTFRDASGTSITEKGKVLVGTGASSGIPAHQFGIGYGDTLLANAAISLGSAVSDPVTTSDLSRAAAARDSYQLGFDLALRTSGKLVDLTLPSFDDPFFLGLKEILGQKPADPMSPMEGVVEFLYSSPEPFEIPALKGETVDDSGDYAIPYLQSSNTELSRLDQAASASARVVTAQNGGFYVYPDEVVGADGEIVGAAGAAFGSLAVKEPATLMTTQDAFAATHDPAELGVGDVRPYDLLLVRVGQSAIQDGAQGILTVGAVASPEFETGEYGGFFEPPRFVTATTPPPGDGSTNQTGSPVRYVLTNAMVHVDGYAGDTPQLDSPTGIILTEEDSDGDAVLDRTVLDFSGLGSIAFNDGLVAGQGGFNDIFSANPADARSYNEITIRLYARSDAAINDTPGGNPMPDEGALLYTITFKRDGANVVVEGTDWAGSTTLSQVVSPGDVTFGAGTDSKQIIIEKAGLIDLNSVGADDEWFLPYAETNAGASGWTKTTLYGWDFSVSLNTYNWDGVNKGQSNTAWIGEDRLTFNEVVDFRWAKPRGYTHPLNAATNLQTELLVHEVTCGNGLASSVNRDVNGGTAFTFLERSSGLGSWTAATAAPTREYGSIKAMGFEGHGNTAITATDVAFSAIPSSDYGETGVVCEGTGVTESKDNASVSSADLYDDRVTQITVTSGDVSSVEAGDLLVIEGSDNGTHTATTKAGTYLVRYALAANNADDNFHTDPVTLVGDGNGWVNQAFPVVGALDTTAATLTVDQTEGFSATGRVYLILNQQALSSTDADTFKEALVSASYGSLTGTQFGILADYKWADGSTPSAAELAVLEGVVVGKRVSGMGSLGLSVSSTAGLPDLRVVGYHDPAGGSPVVYGFRYLKVVSPSGAAAKVFDATGAGPDELIEDGSTPAAGNVSVAEASLAGDLWEYQSEPDAVVYKHVPGSLHLNLTNAQWQDLNDPNGYALGDSVSCLVPGTLLSLEDGSGTAGFIAQGGIFLEPSFPRPVFNLGALYPRVVDAAHDLTSFDVGMRSFDDYLGAGEVAPTTPEGVSFSVRRIRRFHEVQEDVANILAPLRFAYEIRRGRVTAYSSTDKQFGLLDADSFAMTWNADNPGAPRAADVWNEGGTYSGTHLGAFDDPDVNVHAGDMLRILDDNGDLLEEVQIASVVSATRLKLMPPGITSLTPVQMVGKRFEVYLRQAPVPHEQTNEQLLGLITSETVLHTIADYDTQQGGYVPAMPDGGSYADYANLLYDDLNVEGVKSYHEWGVEVGDVVVVDPAGTLPQIGGLPAVREMGARPQGDASIPDRAPNVPSPYQAGAPSPLDDNRGYYRVVEVADDHLVVTGASRFAGTNGSDVVFPEEESQREDFGYTIYPTVSASGLTGGTEGQMDLRPTAYRDDDSKSYQVYKTPGDNGAVHSIRPFSYKIIRPSPLFSEDTVDLVLATRERTLSLLEMLRAPFSGRKSGTYHVFQRDEHCSDLGHPDNAEQGLGVLTNAVIQGLVGKVGFSPFANDSDCVSILDRRFWILDTRLDSLEPQNSFKSRKLDGGVAYTAFSDVSGGASVRPVLPDMVGMVLDSEERLRALRYSWLVQRTHLVQGTLAAIQRFDDDLPRRLAEAKRAMLLKETTDKA